MNEQKHAKTMQQHKLNNTRQILNELDYEICLIRCEQSDGGTSIEQLPLANLTLC